MMWLPRGMGVLPVKDATREMSSTGPDWRLLSATSGS